MAAETRLKESNEEKLTLQASISAQEATLTSIRDQLTQSEERVAAALAEKSELGEKLIEMESTQMLKEEERLREMAANETMEGLLAEYKDKAGVMESALSEATQALEELRAKNERDRTETQQEMERTKENLEETKSKLSASEEERVLIEDEKISLAAEAETRRAEVNSLKAETDALKAEVGIVREEAKATSKNNESRQMEMEELRESLRGKEKELETLRAQREAEIREAKETRKEKEEKLQEALASYEAGSKSIANEVADAVRVKEELEAQLVKEKENYELREKKLNSDFEVEKELMAVSNSRMLLNLEKDKKKLEKKLGDVTKASEEKTKNFETEMAELKVGEW